MKLETALIHAGEPRPGWGGAVAMPIFQSSTFLYQPGAGYHDIRYGRLSNTPNHEALHRKLAALEGTESALVTASGMAAISAALLSVLRTGDHLLAQEGLYGGTHDLLTGDFPQLGIEVSFVDGEDRSAWAAALRKTTRAFYCESISNPLVRVADLEGVASFSRSNGLISMIDNTFATPIGLRPTSLGFDLILHSATKYLNGHDDLIAGAVMGSSERISSVKHKLDHLGGSMDPHACFMLHGISRKLSRIGGASSVPAGTFALGAARSDAELRARGRRDRGRPFLQAHPITAHCAKPGRRRDAGHPSSAYLSRGPVSGRATADRHR
jgi:cystathionine gamma-synthase/cystathionine gamma-lyase/cystathionine beta-lyase